MGHTLSRSFDSPNIPFKKHKVQDFHDFVKDISKEMILETEEYTNKALERLDRLVWCNPALSEVQEVADIVETFVAKVVEKLNMCDNRMKFNLVRSGSYYEGLRVGHPYEFDYMLELQLFHLSRVTVSKGSTTKYRLYSDDNVLETGQFSKEDGLVFSFLSGKKDVIHFSANNDQASVPNVDEEVGREVLPIELSSDIHTKLHHIVNGFPTGFHEGLTVIQSNIIKDFQPNFCVKMIYKGIGIMIDLVPCLKFPSKFTHVLPAIPAKVEKFMSDFIPEANSNVQGYVSEALYFVCSKSRWRLSYSKVEQTILHHFPDEAKQALRVLKYMCNSFFPVASDSNELLDIFGYNALVQSYHLKCFFLNTMITLHDTNRHHYFRSGYLTLMTLLHNCTFLEKASRLVFHNRDVFFSDAYQVSFTFVEESDSHKIIQLMGQLLKYCMEDDDWSRFRMINYPNVHNVKLGPSYLCK